jgi:hypothetical protein
MELDKVLESVVSSVMAAIVLGVFAWVWTCVRNYRLQAKLQVELSPNCFSAKYSEKNNEGSFSIVFSNNSHAGVQIRNVTLSGGPGNRDLNLVYDDDYGVRSKNIESEISKTVFNKISLFNGFTYGESMEGSVGLPPKTMGT